MSKPLEGMRYRVALAAAFISFTTIYIVIAALVRHPLLNDADTFLHISVGEWILQNERLPVVDTFSYTAFGKPWFAVDWLGELALAVAYRAAQWEGVIQLTAITFGLIAGVLTFYLARILRLSVALSLTLVICVLISPSLLARPVIFSYLLLSIWIVLILEFHDQNWTSTWIYILIPLMLLWANVHASFTFALLVLYIFLCSAIYKAHVQKDAVELKHLFLLMAGVTVSALVTPYGPESALRTLRLMSLPVLSQIDEWQPPNFKQDPIHLGSIVVVFAVLAYSGIRLRGAHLFTLLLVTVFALGQKRGLGLFGLVAPLILARPIAEWLPALRVQDERDPVTRFARSRTRFIAMVCVGITMVAVIARWTTASEIRPPARILPEKAVAAARIAGVTGHVLNSYRFGGYLIFKGIPVFVDGRVGLYGNRFLRDYFRAMGLRDAGEAARLLRQYNVEWALLVPGEPIAFMLEENEWVRLYKDRYAVVFAKRQ